MGRDLSGVEKLIDRLESSAACPLFDTRFAEEILASVRTLPEQESQAENCSKQSGFFSCLEVFLRCFFCWFVFNNQGP